MPRSRSLALVAVALAAAVLNLGAVRRFLNDVEILGTLDVTGDTTLGGAVSSSGSVAFEGPVAVTRTFTVDPGGIDVYGTARLRGLASADRTFSVGSDLDVTGEATIEGPASVSRTFTIDPGALDVYGATRLRGLASADRTFSVSDLSASGNVGVDGTLSVADSVTIESAAVIAPLYALLRDVGAPLVWRFYSKTLSSGSASWDVSSDTIGDVVGVVATRKAASGGGAEVATNWSGTTVSVDDGSGSSSDVVSVLVWGTPPE